MVTFNPAQNFRFPTQQSANTGNPFNPAGASSVTYVFNIGSGASLSGPGTDQFSASPFAGQGMGNASPFGPSFSASPYNAAMGSLGQMNSLPSLNAGLGSLQGIGQGMGLAGMPSFGALAGLGGGLNGLQENPAELGLRALNDPQLAAAFAADPELQDTLLNNPELLSGLLALSPEQRGQVLQNPGSLKALARMNPSASGGLNKAQSPSDALQQMLLQQLMQSLGNQSQPGGETRCVQRQPGQRQFPGGRQSRPV